LSLLGKINVNRFKIEDWKHLSFPVSEEVDMPVEKDSAKEDMDIDE
jgi:hypothetical protein